MDGKALWILLGALVITSGIFAYPWVANTMKIDRCLDSGGRWDSVTGLCDFRPE